MCGRIFSSSSRPRVECLFVLEIDMKKKCVWLNAEIAQRLKKYCQLRGLAMTDLVNKAVEQSLNRREGKK